MGSSRFFVANLPPNTKEHQLREIFQDYGTVERVELKTKENPFEADSVKVIAFVTLQIHPNDVNNCVGALNWVTINGAKIKVSVAKESFLERLKREREEAEKGKNANNQVVWNKEPIESVLPRNAENTRKTFTEEELTELANNDDIAADLLISKKRAASSLHNGRIVIQSYDTTPLHIIEAAKKKKKKADGSETVAEQKRKESQNKKTKQYKEKKSVIQQALSVLHGSKSKKIKFSDAEEEDEHTSNVPHPNQKSTTNIFGSDDEEETDMKLELKPELFGKKGGKLLEMQSKQSLDPRFRIDAKFVEDEEDVQVESAEKNDYETSEEVINERSWQIGILDQVVGTKLDTANNAQKAARKKRMLRYDPSKEGDQKLLRATIKEASAEEDITVPKAANKKQKKQEVENEKSTIEESAPEVSKDVFYVVTDTLAESLKTRGDGFSLLKMFGNDQAQDKRADELKKVSDAKILVNKLDKNALNPFKYDSSSDEEGENETKQSAAEANQKTLKKEKKQNKILLESFFIPRNDARLKEGAKFFRYEKKDAPEEDYEAVRNRLKLLIRNKINKTKKNLLASSGGGRVGHKRRIKGHH
ncbi:probable RNA-binding protein CG14230 [Anastrepha ludens]|uniref:probable RNA-binding protein CG14230 n=1 Tax=Anastrepha ludens TaxID=28586 RepID=UPI0023B08C64|nr:probable RNA-binding protein CG14230 [Anastrepha ludens]